MRFHWRTQNDDPAADEKVGQLAASTTPSALTNEPSLTQQQFTAETDINVMMKRMGVTDQAVPPTAFPEGTLTLDYTHLDGLEYRDVLDRMRTAQEAFQQLPAELRARFFNRPENLWEFVNNPKNDDEAIKLGLLKRHEDAPSATATDTSPPNSATTS